MKSQFEVYLRLKPCQKQIIFDYQRILSEHNALVYQVQNKNRKLDVMLPKHTKFGLINNSKENMDFQFTHIFEERIVQEEIFNTVALPVIHTVLDGYNGTIFAYGQTGSGKTYTMSGAETWQLRGIIPRVLSVKKKLFYLIQFIFDEIDRKTNVDYSVYISFMEIYNENAYDLLEKKHLELPMEQWNKIQLYEDEFQNIHLKNVSVHHCANEQEGIDLLMMGNFIRQVSATPMNQCSSRSHCVFTITLEGREKGSETCFLSKLHLVDLAGSERISKTHVEGNLFNEARHINLSLTYLEQVIIALNEKMKGFNRQHIPYRNSLMTTILKDSLGGNCKTVMIATISAENENLEESLSTLRFSQRVGQLENEIRKNEKVDLAAVVKRLEQEKLVLIRELEQYQKVVGPIPSSSQKNLRDISLMSRPKPEYNEEVAIEEVQEKVEMYLNERSSSLEVKSIFEAQLCFEAMKDLYNSRMKEYVTELTFISEKLQKYDEILTRKKQEQSFLENQKENIDYDIDIYRPNEKVHEPVQNGHMGGKPIARQESPHRFKNAQNKKNFN